MLTVRVIWYSPQQPLTFGNSEMPYFIVLVRGHLFIVFYHWFPLFPLQEEQISKCSSYLRLFSTFGDLLQILLCLLRNQNLRITSNKESAPNRVYSPGDKPSCSDEG